MSSRPATEQPRLSINRIRPVDLDDPAVRDAQEQARTALANPRLGDILAVRTAIQHYLGERLIAAGYVHPPAVMLAACTDPLNHMTYPAATDYYGEEVSLTQSLILQKILMVMLSPVPSVFWTSPNVRMEQGTAKKGYKYASEFTQVDFERREGTYQEMLGFIGSLVAGLHERLRGSLGAVIERLRGEPLPAIRQPLAVHDVARVMAAEGLPDGDAVERWAAERSGGQPFLLVNMRREAYDAWDPEAGRFLNYDVVYPPAGANPHPVECLSGAERTRSVGDLRARMAELGYPAAYFEPFFGLFDALDHAGGRIASAGAGFGIERLTYAVLGLPDIHQVYPFPRHPEARIAI